SSRPGSWIVTSPRESDSTFSGTMSRATTRWPSSAKQAAVTSPTQPTPISPIGSLSAALFMARLHPLFPLLVRDLDLPPGRDADPLVIGQGAQEAVRHPVGVVAPMPGDHLYPIAVEQDVVFAAVDRFGQARFADDRRVGPALDPLQAEVVDAVGQFE